MRTHLRVNTFQAVNVSGRRRELVYILKLVFSLIILSFFFQWNSESEQETRHCLCFLCINGPLLFFMSFALMWFYLIVLFQYYWDSCTCLGYFNCLLH